MADGTSRRSPRWWIRSILGGTRTLSADNTYGRKYTVQVSTPVYAAGAKMFYVVFKSLYMTHVILPRVDGRSWFEEHELPTMSKADEQWLFGEDEVS